MKNNAIMQPEGNYYDKYNSSNIIVKWMMKNYFSALDSLFPDLGERAKILEAGCGEGEIAGHVLQKCTGQQTIEGFDISEKVILDAQKKYPEIRFSTGNIYEIAGGV